MTSNGEQPEPCRRDLLLIAEDNAADLMLIRLAIEEHGIECDIHAVPDGEAAVRYVEQVESDRSRVCPTLAILDLNLPRLGGAEILRRVRACERWRCIPVIVASSSQSLRDRAKVMQLGASAYFPKPSDREQFLRIGVLIGELLARA